VDDSETQSTIDQSSMGPPPAFGDGRQGTKATFDGAVLGQGNPLQLVQPTPVSGLQGSGLTSNNNNNNNNLNQCRSM
jgi:hypothetical protein